MLQQNPHKVKSLDEEKKIKRERLQATLQKRYEKLPFSERWAVILPVSDMFSWTFTFYAFIVESFAIAYGIYAHYQSTISIVIGAALGLVFGIGIEALKRVCNYNYWHGGMAEGDWNKGNFGGMFLAMALSTGLAFWGGLNLPEVTTTPPIAAVASQENVEALRADYETQIATQEKNIKDFDKNAPRWKGKMGRDAIKKLGEMNSQLQTMMEKKNTVIQDAEARNRQNISDAKASDNAEMSVYIESKASMGWLFGIIAIIIELLIPIPFWAKERYYFKCVTELEQGLTTPTPQTVTIQQQSGIQQITNPHTAPPSGTSPITHKRVVIEGFKQDEENAEISVYTGKNEVLEVVTIEEQQPVENSPEIVENEVVKNVETSVYTSKNDVLEEPQTKPEKQPENVNTVVLIKNTYTHQKDNGGTVEYTLGQLKNRVDDYQSRANEAAKKIEACVESEIDTKFWKDCFRDRSKALSYWKAAYNMLAEQLEQIHNFKTGESTNE